MRSAPRPRATWTPGPSLAIPIAPPSGAPAPDNSPIRVVLVGNQAMLRDGLARLIAGHPKLTLVSEEMVADALPAISQHQPDVLILVGADQLPERTALIAELIRASGRTAILLVSTARDAHADAHAVELGVRGVLMLEQPATVLLKAIEKVHAGEIWLDRAKTATVIQGASRTREAPEQAQIASLTRRELEIVRLIGEGLRNATIAERLFISQATVRNHVTSILGKLDLKDRFDLAVYAFRHGLVRFP